MMLMYVFFIIAGDLTDAKDHSRIFSEQYKEEWEVYHRVLKETQVEAKTDWLDIRGNHGEKGGGPYPTKATCSLQFTDYRVWEV